MRLPFKLSVVAEGLWNPGKSIAYGTIDSNELSTEPDEVLAMIASKSTTCYGVTSDEGPTAMRQVFEADGSVLIVHTTIATSPVSPKQLLSEDAFANLIAGTIMKQAGWTRIRLVSTRHGRPLVLVESATGSVLEAPPGYSFPRDRQQKFLVAMNEVRAPGRRLAKHSRPSSWISLWQTRRSNRRRVLSSQATRKHGGSSLAARAWIAVA